MESEDAVVRVSPTYAVSSYAADCASFGVPFVLQANDPELLGRMLSVVPYATELVGIKRLDASCFSLRMEDGRNAFYVDETPVFTSSDLPLVLETLGRDLMVHVANLAPDYVFVHAGVVGWRGGALVMPGKSFAGKTTLTAALVRAGATYYSDEYAVLDAAGRVNPYARDLQMRQPGGSMQTGVSVETLNGAVGTDSLPVSRVIFAEYAVGASWSPQPVSSGMAVLEILRHAIPVQRTPARVMATLAAMMQSATAWRGERGEAGETAKALLTAMDAAALDATAV